MPTNEERREVAARLRGMADSRYCDTKNTLVLAGALLTVVGVDAASGTAEDIMRRLADLIEPEPERTCRMNKRESKYVLSGWWECSECGGIVYPPCNEEIALWALQYCPHCGAKVVSDD